MEKKIFIEAIEALEKQMNYDKNVSINLGDAFPNAHEANLLPNNSILSNMLIRILQNEMNDSTDFEQSVICFYCYKLDFGFDYTKNCFRDKHNNFIDISNTDKLWDYLNNEKKKEGNK